MHDEVIVRDVKADELSACESLYVSVMGLRPNDGSINPRLLAALQANSGVVLGAYAEGELIGFAYSFLGREGAGAARRSETRLYQYSQLAVVSPKWQGKGVGRKLKYAQRARCLAEGITLMRWAFDPVKTRNAYFNLNVLGGRAVKLIPSMYGDAGFGGDTGDRTDRFIVEWDLGADTGGAGPIGRSRTPRTEIQAAQLKLGESRHGIDEVSVAIPARWERYRAEWGPHAAAELREKLRDQFTKVLDAGWVGVSCDVVDPETALYRFVPDHQDRSAMSAERKADECR